MTLSAVILIVQAIASGAMCGIIWFVQIIHYPLFEGVGGDGRAYALENARRTARVVIPFMLAEAATAAAIAWSPPQGIPVWVALLGLGLVLVACLSTALVQLPLHRRLGRAGVSAGVVATLVRSNWVRTAAWSARAVVAAWMLHAAG